jgi:predicted amidophosphoribosyltransferase
MLVRTTPLPSSEKRNEERQKATLRAELPFPGPVVLLDDVLTSGATIRACYTVLREAGVQVVGVLCICATVDETTGVVGRGAKFIRPEPEH